MYYFDDLSRVSCAEQEGPASAADDPDGFTVVHEVAHASIPPPPYPQAAAVPPERRLLGLDEEDIRQRYAGPYDAEGDAELPLRHPDPQCPEAEVEEYYEQTTKMRRTCTPLGSLALKGLSDR